MEERTQATPDSDYGPAVRVEGYLDQARLRMRAGRWSAAVMMLRLADMAARRLPRTSRAVEQLEAAWDHVGSELERER